MKNKKRVFNFILLIVIVIFTSACSDNNSRYQVNKYMNSYININNKVLSQVYKEVDKLELNEENNILYKEVLLRQFSDLKYEIIGSTMDTNNCIYNLEIEVYDFKKIIDKMESNLLLDPSEYIEDNKFDKNLYDKAKFTNMLNTENRVNYYININVIKDNDEWIVNNLDRDSLLKLEGLY